MTYVSQYMGPVISNVETVGFNLKITLVGNFQVVWNLRKII